MPDIKLVMPRELAEEVSREPGLVASVAVADEAEEFEFGLGEVAAIVTIVLGLVTLPEKVGALAAKLKAAVARRAGSTTIMVRGPQDDTPVHIGSDTSIEDIVAAIERALQDHGKSS